MAHNTWIFVHIVGMLAVVMSLATLSWHVLSGGRRQFPGRRMMMLTHGFGLMAVLASGIVMAGAINWPAWIPVKFAIWLALGGIAHLIFRFPNRAMVWWWTVWILAVIAAAVGTAAA